jgi:hypothetical protein
LRADQADDGTLGQVGGLRILGTDDQPVSSSALMPENTGVVCFAKGTLITTARGAVPIEDLAPGDRVKPWTTGCNPSFGSAPATLTPANLRRANTKRCRSRPGKQIFREKWCPGAESNCRHEDFQTEAY